MFGLRILRRRCKQRFICTSSLTSDTKPTDSCGIPTQPTWSVDQLLSSYSSPKLSDASVDRLYAISGLLAPSKGTAQFENTKKDLEEMIRLVEAVRLVDTSKVSLKDRVEINDADRQSSSLQDFVPGGQDLLKYASRSKDGYYIVDSNKNQ